MRIQTKKSIIEGDILEETFDTTIIRTDNDIVKVKNKDIINIFNGEYLINIWLKLEDQVN